VSVIDENDHAPTFVSPAVGNTTMTIPNNMTVGSLILKASATDVDEDSRFEYSLPGSKQGSLFQVMCIVNVL
jgi:hypothetical protein